MMVYSYLLRVDRSSPTLAGDVSGDVSRDRFAGERECELVGGGMEVEREGEWEGGRREEGIFSAQVPVVLSHDAAVVVGIASEGPSGGT